MYFSLLPIAIMTHTAPRSVNLICCKFFLMILPFIGIQAIVVLSNQTESLFDYTEVPSTDNVAISSLRKKVICSPGLLPFGLCWAVIHRLRGSTNTKH